MVLGFAAAAGAQDEGVKQVEQFAKKARATVEAIENSRVQLLKTMDTYNGLMAKDATDRKGAFKKLQQQMAQTEERRAEIAVRAGEMDAEAETLFAGWAKSAAAIGDAELRKRSETRLTAAKASHARIKSVGRMAADAYAPVMKALGDQVTYLGHDLNPSAVASLDADAARLRTAVQELVKKIDDTMLTANSAVAALSPQ
jgi:hypothetical protein